MIRPPGLRARAALWILAVLVPILGGAGGALIWRLWDQALVDARLQAASTLTPLSTLVAIALATGDVETVDDYLAEVTDSSLDLMPILYLADLDSERKRLTFAHPTATGSLEGVSAPWEFEEKALASPLPLWRLYPGPAPGQTLLACSMPAVSGHREGTLVAVFDVTGPVSMVRRSVVYYTLFTLAITALATLAMYKGLGWLVVEPVRVLAGAAARIQGGDLDARAGLRRSDEIGQLSSTFDAMADRIRAYTEDLERQVAQRTAELDTRNQELAAANTQLARANKALEEIARVDPLTGIFNRRYFDEIMNLELRRSQRSHNSWCLLMTDIDHFKSVNDTYGHPTGDRVLSQVAAVFRKHLRSTDMLARYGGEEFVAILVDTPRVAAMQVAEKLRKEVELTPFTTVEGQPMPRVTVSIGVSAFPDDGLNPFDLLGRADAALYAAKHGGRNRVVSWSPQAVEKALKPG